MYLISLVVGLQLTRISPAYSPTSRIVRLPEREKVPLWDAITIFTKSRPISPKIEQESIVFLGILR